MLEERAELIRQVLDLQTCLYRSLGPAREWLEVELTMPQLKVLFLLYWEGAASMGRLASSLGVTLSTATGIIDRLVEHGVVQREENPHDRRIVVCRLTTQGMETMERLHQAGRSRLASLLDGLSIRDLRTVAAGLDVLSAAARRRAAEEDGAAAHVPTQLPAWSVRAAPSSV
jgi:DNA-binding MarR family transcriptional regulator